MGPVEVNPARFDLEERDKNGLYMPDAQAAEEAGAYLKELMAKKDSSGGVVECEISGLPVGIGKAQRKPG